MQLYAFSIALESKPWLPRYFYELNKSCWRKEHEYGKYSILIACIGHVSIEHASSPAAPYTSFQRNNLGVQAKISETFLILTANIRASTVSGSWLVAHVCVCVSGGLYSFLFARHHRPM